MHWDLDYMKQELIKVVGLGNVSFDTSHTTYPSNAILLRKISINGKYYIRLPNS